MKKTDKPSSPNWSTSTKIIISLIIIATVIALLIRFSNLLNTLITAFIIAVLYHPIAEWINKKFKLPWTWSVSIIYFFTVIILFGLLTVGGIALVNQISSLINFLQNILGKLPALFDQLTALKFRIGPFNFDFSYINWNQIGNQLLTTIEPILTRIGNLFGSIASGAVGFVGSLLLSLLISFLLITETEGVRDRMLKIEIPGYQEDLYHLGTKVQTIWNEFLRGQSLIFLFRFILYLVILSAFRLKFVFGMALLATLGNFIPYIGVAIVWTINFFVALFQGTTIFGLEPFIYALIVMGVGWISDNLYDTFFTPRFMGNILKLHPAAVLVAVLIGLNLFGLLGMFLAPPTLATLRVLLRYIEYKLQDLNPWRYEEPDEPEEKSLPFLGRIAMTIQKRVNGLLKNKNNDPDEEKR